MIARITQATDLNSNRWDKASRKIGHYKQIQYVENNMVRTIGTIKNNYNYNYANKMIVTIVFARTANQ